MSNERGIVERLNDEWQRLAGRSLDRGCVDSGIASNLAQEAAARIEQLEARVRELSDNEGCCDGCGSTMSMADLRKRGAISCCPERKMLSAKQWSEKAKALEAENAELRAALEPFAGYLDTAAFDLDDKGHALPDEQGMGWVYLTLGQFRRARAALAGKAGDDGDWWLIRKNGYFYRANYSGYTVNIDEAGRYSEADAKSEASIEPGNMKAIKLSEARSKLAGKAGE